MDAGHGPDGKHCQGISGKSAGAENGAERNEFH